MEQLPGQSQLHVSKTKTKTRHLKDNIMMRQNKTNRTRVRQNKHKEKDKEKAQVDEEIHTFVHTGFSKKQLEAILYIHYAKDLQSFRKYCHKKTLQDREPPKISLTSFCVGHLLPSVRLVQPARLHGREPIFHLQVIINWRWLLSQGWGPLSLHFSLCWSLLWCWPCVCCHSLS